MKKLIIPIFAVLVVAVAVRAQLQTMSAQNGALFNTTAVQVSAASSSDQNLQQLVEPAGTLNYIGKTTHIVAYGTVTSGASGNGTWTVKLKLCTVSGCGSGTALTLISVGPTGTQPVSVTNAPFHCEVFVTTTATGASGTVFPVGYCSTESTSATIQTDSPTWIAQTTASSSAIDLTGQLYWQVTLADSGASANNVINGRFLSRVFFN